MRLIFQPMVDAYGTILEEYPREKEDVRRGGFVSRATGMSNYFQHKHLKKKDKINSYGTHFQKKNIVPAGLKLI